MIKLPFGEEDFEKPSIVCDNCWDFGYYYTEWSNAAEADPEQEKWVIEYPDPPDGTVCIACPHCESGALELELKESLE